MVQGTRETLPLIELLSFACGLARRGQIVELLLIALYEKDMHYADFAEDEVSSFVRLTRDPNGMESFADAQIECCAAPGNQRLREQQVEGDRPEGWQARQGECR